MTYDGSRDSAFLTVGSSTLQVLAALVSDNGEGNDWPHGPAGNLYYDAFDCREYMLAPPDRADRRRIEGPRVLRGPDNTHGQTYEWGADDQLLLYSGAGLFNWGGRNCVALRIWESDSLSEDGSWGRRNDVLGLERIEIANTMSPDGVWVPFHKYTNDHPRRRTAQISVWLKLKTHNPDASTVMVVYGSGYPHGVAFEVDGIRYQLNPGQAVAVNLSGATSMLSIWQCPRGSCSWARFSIAQGHSYRIVDTRGGGLQLVE